MASGKARPPSCVSMVNCKIDRSLEPSIRPALYMLVELDKERDLSWDFDKIDLCKKLFEKKEIFVTDRVGRDTGSPGLMQGEGYRPKA